MKKILLSLLFALYSLGSYAQELEKTFETNLTKNQEYLNYLNWSSVNQVFVRNKEIVSKDENSGNVITSLTMFKIDNYNEYILKTSIRADFKNNKYKISVNDPVIRFNITKSATDSASSTTLVKLIDKLEIAIEIGKEINQMAEWQYKDLINLRDKRNKEISDAEILLKSSQDKKEIRKINSLIKRHNNQLTFLNDVIDQSNNMINILFEDINKNIAINNDW